VLETTVKTSGASILVPPGISIKPVINATLPVSGMDIAAVPRGVAVHAKFRLEYSADAGHYEVASFGIDRADAPLEVNGAFWRTVRVQSIVRSVIEVALPIWTQPIVEMRGARGVRIDYRTPDYSPGDPDGHLLTAVVYRVAEISSENPALAVAETLGLKQRTATNWIQRAREAGYLSSTEHQRDARRIAEELQRLNPHETGTWEELAYRLGWDGKSKGERDGND
jgi:hypothetical protein